MALANPGDRILGLELAHGGHLTHGMRLNFSGKMYEAHAYGLNPETFLIDMDIVRQRAHEVKPAVLIAGWSAYSRHLDFAEFRKIADEVSTQARFLMQTSFRPPFTRLSPGLARV
jgi:glycine hydroxymethyltransferase